MNLNGLQRQVEKLVVLVEKRQSGMQTHELADAFTWDVFTSDEQGRLHVLLERLQPKITWQHGISNLNELTVEEKDQLESWIVLQEARESGDRATAERCQRYLLLTPEDKERIYSAFMAIDERCFVEVSHCSDAPTVEWEGRKHHIYRRGYQWQKDHERQHTHRGSYLRRWEIDRMWMWLTAAQGGLN